MTWRDTPLVVWLLAAMYFAGAVQCGLFVDTVRDLSQALDIANGAHFPLEGPEIAGAFHVGPLWFYLLALPLALGLPLPAVAWLTAAVGASQFWFAWRLGGALRDSRLGVCLALALSLPTWKLIYWLASTHTMLSIPAAAAALSVWACYWNRPSPLLAITGGVAVGIAMHGHPATIALAALLAVAAIRPAQANGRAVSFLLAAAGLVLPFVPWLADEARRGWPDVHAVATYGGSAFTLAQLAGVPRVLAGVIIDGAPAGAVLTLSGQPALGNVVVLATWVALGAGVAGMRAAWRIERLRVALAIAAALVMVTTAAITLSRPFVTYYMADLVTAVFPLAVGIGWYGVFCGSDGEPRFSPWLRSFAGTAILAVGATVLGGWLFAVHAGRIEVPVEQGLNLNRAGPFGVLDGEPALFFGDLPALGTRVCASPQPAFHGESAVFYDLAADLLVRTGCRDMPMPRLGGVSTAGVPDVAGIDCRLAHAAALSAGTRTGRLCWLPVSQNLNSGPGLRAADARIYPPHERIGGTEGAFTYRGTLEPGTVVVLTYLRPDWSDFAEPTLTVSSAPVAPLFRNHRTFAWRIDGDGAGPRDVTVAMRAAQPEAIDLFALRSGSVGAP